VTLVTYPFVYLLVTRAARGEGGASPGVTGSGHLLDGRRKLEDFPEGKAIVSLERWGGGGGLVACAVVARWSGGCMCRLVGVIGVGRVAVAVRQTNHISSSAKPEPPRHHYLSMFSCNPQVVPHQRLHERA